MTLELLRRLPPTRKSDVRNAVRFAVPEHRRQRVSEHGDRYGRRDLRLAVSPFLREAVLGVLDRLDGGSWVSLDFGQLEPPAIEQELGVELGLVPPGDTPGSPPPPGDTPGSPGDDVSPCESAGIPSSMGHWRTELALRTLVLGPVLPYLPGTAPTGDEDRERAIMVATAVLNVFVPEVIRHSFPEEVPVWQGLEIHHGRGVCDDPAMWQGESAVRSPRGSRALHRWAEIEAMRGSMERMRARMARPSGNGLGGLVGWQDLADVFRLATEAALLPLHGTFLASVSNVIYVAMRAVTGQALRLRTWLVVRDLLLRMACLDERCRIHPDCDEHAELGKACFEATVRPWLNLHDVNPSRVHPDGPGAEAEP